MTTKLLQVRHNYQLLGRLADALSGRGLSVRWSDEHGAWLRPSWGRHRVLVSAQEEDGARVYRWSNHRCRVSRVEKIGLVTDQICALLMGGPR